MQDQIRILKEDLKEVNEQITAHKAAAPPVNALAAVPAPTIAAAQLLSLPLATSTRNTAKILRSIALPADRWIDDHHAASSVERKATSSPTAWPAQSSSAFFASKHAPAPADCLEDKYWSCRTQRTTPKLTPTYS